eukprot:CAMPEP_0116142158 /NCGR_PEP_ID=MMETSP0329-20121206/14758_1 /TAXON_ID=697910 /ORGANISM="Pseudo-nitzschia arenysensis, Strain B593" /LENGTH=460 /DNA_ID=CAMNT_0003637373 /DNA_START=155 /DNA_END=1533 /DNA_ORIENTATION=+
MRRSWGRFGEPEQPYSQQVDSLKLPRRRGSFDGDEEDEKLQGNKATGACSSPTMMLSSSTNRPVRHTRMRRRSFRRPSFENPTIESNTTSTDLEDDDDYLCMKAAQQHQQQHQQHNSTEPGETPIRRASTGTKLIARTQPLFDDSDAPQKPRRGSISGPRPCMESTLGSVRDAPLRRRSLGGSRPCMEHITGFGDGPILRPYRQLSADDLCVDMGCIGEETDEDLRSNRSNRSCLIHGDFSNRSNRTSLVHEFSNRSNRTSLIHEFSSRSNRSNLVKEISNRSLAHEISSRSNRSTFRDFSTRSRNIVPNADATISEAAGTNTTSPVQEEPSESSSSSLLPATPPDSNHSNRPEAWPVQKCIDQQNGNPSLSRSKTWPTNLMILLSVKNLSLEHGLCDSDEESGDDDKEENSLFSVDNDGSPHRRKGKSNSPYRNNNRLLRTIHKASELIEGEKQPRTLS